MRSVASASAFATPRSDPERFAAGKIWKRWPDVRVDVGMSDSLQQRQRRARAGHVDDGAFIARPLNARRALAPIQQALSSDDSELKTGRDALVRRRVICDQRRILAESRGACALEQRARGCVLERARENRRRDRATLRKPARLARAVLMCAHRIVSRHHRVLGRMPSRDLETIGARLFAGRDADGDLREGYESEGGYHRGLDTAGGRAVSRRPSVAAAHMSTLSETVCHTGLRERTSQAGARRRIPLEIFSAIAATSTTVESKWSNVAGFALCGM